MSTREREATRSAREAERGGETRVVYTCWPYGPRGYTICGVLLIIVGGAMLAEMVFPSSSRAVWGVALVAVGVWVMARSRQGDDRR